MTAVIAWFDRHVAGAPTVLAARARHYLSGDSGATPADRCAVAGSAALHAAESAGVGREAALDLLAADALITLTLLDLADRTPATLAEDAARLRRQAASAK